MFDSVNFPPAREIPIISTMPTKRKKIDRRIGQAIRAARDERRLSQQRLAAKLDIQRATLSNYERGDRPVPANVLDQICDVLEVKAGYFFPEAETFGSDSVGDAASRQLRVDRVKEMLRNADIETLDAVLTVLDLGTSR